MGRADSDAQIANTNQPKIKLPPERRWTRFFMWSLWLLVPLTLAFAITRQSLWIDEGFTTWFVSRVDFKSFLRSLIGPPPGDAQLLFYLSYLRGWVKIFGRSEVALRAANAPFFLLMIGTAAWAARRLLERPHLWVLFCLSPFVWFYLNEARPYAAVIAFSTTTLVALLAYVLQPAEHASWAPWLCLIGLLFTCGSHLLGAFLIPSLVVVVAESARIDSDVRHRFISDWWLPVLCCGPAFVILGGFYAWTSLRGVSKIVDSPGLLNLAFIVYEFLGFQGLGPPRNELRNGLQPGAIVEYGPWLLLGVAALGLVAFSLFRKRPPSIVYTLFMALTVGVAVAFAISRLERFHVLGRHMAVFFPLVLLIGMFWLSDAAPFGRYERLATVLTIVLAATWAVSDARLVLLPQYKKDDYRDAASIALQTAEATGAEILWVADPHTARYYGIEVMKDHHPIGIGITEGITLPIRRQATDVRHFVLEDAVKYVASRKDPAVLVVSKPDIFDDLGGWQAFVREQRPAHLAQLNSFSLYLIVRNSGPAAPSLPTR